MLVNEYSTKNHANIQATCPGASELDGMSGWNRKGYIVKPGAQGVVVWYPVAYNEDGEAIRFSQRTVFDRSQVEFIGKAVQSAPRVNKPAERKHKITLDDLLRG